MNCRLPFFAIPVLALLAACGPGDGADAVNDTPPQWRLSSEPLVTIGQREGAAAYLLDYVASAFRLPNGDIVVANSGTADIRIFDSTGVHKRTVGSRGDGPGEFQNLRAARAIQGDTIITWDPVRRRISRFGSTGQLVTSVSPDFSTMVGVRMGGRDIPATPSYLHFLGNGGGVVEPSFPTFVTTDRPNGIHRDSTYLFVYNGVGEVAGRVGPLAGGETFVHDRQSVGAFFGHRLMIAGASSFFYFGTGKPYEIKKFGSDGTALGEVAGHRAAAPVTSEAVQARKERFLAMMRGGASESDRDFVNAMPMPDSMPSYSAILTDRDDNLWVEEYDWRSDQPRTWAVFTKDGESVGRLTVPADLEVMDVGRSYLIGLHRDELDVQQVQVYGVRQVDDSSDQ